MDYERKIFPYTGGYGRYNRLVVLFSWFPNFAAMLNLFSDVFYTLIPESYHCRADPQLLPSAFLRSNFSRQRYLNLTIPWVNGTGLSRCELFKYPPNSSDLSEKVSRVRVSCTVGWEYAHVAGLQSNFVTEWNLVCNDYWKIPLQHICFMTGWILGYILLGTLCDWLGRRRCFLLSISLSSLLGVAVCLSSSVVVFLLLRLSQGAMLAGVFISSYIARLELCDPPHRLMVAMVSGFFAVFAELLLPGIAVLCRNWPVLQAVATLPLLLLLSYWWFIGTGIQYCFTRNLHSYFTNFYFSYFLRVITGALACIFICLSVNHFGRRDLRGGLVLVLSVIGLLFSQALAMLSVLFACEVMPTVVRGGCLGLVLAAGCVGMAASSLMELQNNSGYFLHHVIFASFAVLSVLCIMLLPESKRKPLPDSLKDGESQRRPPLFLSRPDRDNLPLLCTRPPLSEYNPDNYSRLVSATKRMLTKDNLPYRIAVPTHTSLLSDSETQGQENETLREDSEQVVSQSSFDFLISPSSPQQFSHHFGHLGHVLQTLW
ncbi:hypothetical protein FQN60_011035 [Etheostoma spectabile]|uniref:Major facilitator superfamily (MFS) profile domain-containing protein n=1 Tax=Etheostoma spectabile TaxID=54343 RepID=A0A5J5DQR3_9PERO|nr:hypothetical protein FQN60_011035 [Etheostoma spectabile]